MDERLQDRRGRHGRVRFFAARGGPGRCDRVRTGRDADRDHRLLPDSRGLTGSGHPRRGRVQGVRERPRLRHSAGGGGPRPCRRRHQHRTAPGGGRAGGRPGRTRRDDQGGSAGGRRRRPEHHSRAPARVGAGQRGAPRQTRRADRPHHQLTAPAVTGLRLLAVAAAMVAALIGCDPSRPAGPVPPGPSAPVAPQAPPDPQTLLRAGATAIANLPGSTLVFIAEDTDSAEDTGTWTARLVTTDGTEQQVTLGVDGDVVLDGPVPVTDTGTDKVERRERVGAARLDYRGAVDKTLAAVPDGSITELRLNGDADGVRWAATVWDLTPVAHRVTLDAASGELIADTTG